MLAAPGRQIDLSTPMGRMIVQFIAMVDEYYVLDAKLRQEDNARRRRERKVSTRAGHSLPVEGQTMS